MQVSKKQAASVMTHLEAERARQEAKLRTATEQKQQATEVVERVAAVLKPAEEAAKSTQSVLEPHRSNVSSTGADLHSIMEQYRNVNSELQRVHRVLAEDKIGRADANHQQAVMHKWLANHKLATLDTDLISATGTADQMQQAAQSASAAAGTAVQQKDTQAAAVAELESEMQAQTDRYESEVAAIEALKSQQQLWRGQLQVHQVQLEQAQAQMGPAADELAKLLEKVAASSTEARQAASVTANADIRANETRTDMERAKGVLVEAEALVTEAEQLVANTTTRLVETTRALQQAHTDDSETQATILQENRQVLRSVMQKQAEWAKEQAEELEDRAQLLRHTEQQAAAAAAANHASTDAMSKWKQAQQAEQQAEQEAAQAAMEASILQHKREMADRLGGGCFVTEYCCPTEERCCDSPKARTVKLQEKVFITLYYVCLSTSHSRSSV